jgi:hypothetical protein
MYDAVSDVVVFYERKDLCLIDIPGVCPRVDDTVSITGIRCTDILRLSVVPPHGIGTNRGER